MNIPELLIQDEDGEFYGIPFFSGKSPYAAAVEGGYSGTEEQFNQALGDVATNGSVNTKFNGIVGSIGLEEREYNIDFENIAGMYNVSGNKVDVSGAAWKHTIVDIRPNTKYLVNGRSGSNSSSYPLGAFLNAGGSVISSFGTDASTTYTRYEVESPSNAVKMVVNHNYWTASKPMIIIESRESSEAEKNSIELGKEVSDMKENRYYDLNLANVLVREAKKNPFEMAALDKGYVSFVFDDSRTDLDKVASIFESYGFPLGMATVIDAIDRACSGLTAASGSYTKGMSVRNVIAKTLELGGEVFTHSSSVITATNQYDYDFMYENFVINKKRIEKEFGTKVRGQIRAGGTDALASSPEIEKWLIGNYDYSNNGVAENYNKDRTNITTSVSSVKAMIDDAVTNKKWIRFMGHGIASSTSGNDIAESTLKEILTYCQTKGISVVTYAYMFDNFSSSKLLNSI